MAIDDFPLPTACSYAATSANHLLLRHSPRSMTYHTGRVHNPSWPTSANSSNEYQSLGINRTFVTSPGCWSPLWSSSSCQSDKSAVSIQIAAIFTGKMMRNQGLNSILIEWAILQIDRCPTLSVSLPGLHPPGTCESQHIYRHTNRWLSLQELPRHDLNHHFW